MKYQLVFIAVLTLFMAALDLSAAAAFNSSSSNDLELLSESIDKLTQVMEQQGANLAASQCQNNKPLRSRTPKSGFGDQVINLEEKVAQLEEEVGALQSQVKLMEHSGTPKGKNVYFNVVSKKDFVCYGCILLFEETRADSHNAMNPSSGIFTAPLNGFYLFQFHALVDSRESKLEFLVNGLEVMHVYDRDASNTKRRFAMVSQSFIHRLLKGDEVSIRMHKGSIKGGGKTTFTSFLGTLLDSLEDNEI